MSRNESEVVSRTFLSQFWRKFKRNQFAMIGLLFSLFIILVALFAPYWAPYDYRSQQLDYRMQPPSREHWLGTDHFGRDLFSRVILGTRVSLSIGFSATLMVGGIGTIAGLVAGYFGGRTDWVIMRIVDILMSLPGLFLMIVIVALFGPSLVNTVLVIGLTRWSGIARLARANTLAVKNEEFVEAARSTGATHGRIISRHIVPNVIAPIIVWVSLFLGRAILLEAGLSYLGLGAQPPLPSWGNLVADGQKFITIAWLHATAPGFAILLTVLSFNLMGDGIRDALDPKEQ